ncbi:MAG: EAL domain-containing protein [Actinomycetota bacterium]|nr:EAL domain-containing protein [Actinomycetota bacterium]
MERLTLLADLRRAIDADELTLHYQPQADLRQDRITGVEALVRWRHPQRGMLAPDQFIPAAEQSSLMSRSRWP